MSEEIVWTEEDEDAARTAWREVSEKLGMGRKREFPTEERKAELLKKLEELRKDKNG